MAYSTYVMVAAIDFGTTFSGYAFSFVKTPDGIMMNKSWGENLGFQSYKTSTSVLVGPDGNFEDFGFEAEERYSEMLEEGEDSGYQLYRHFKMILHRLGVSHDSQVTSVAGESTNAMKIFVMALRYMKDHLLKAVGKQTASDPDVDLIKWVVTVPAIWTDEAKNFMREAAYQAGLITNKNSDHLVIALEPEAASLYCQGLDINQFTHPDKGSIGFRTGTKYLVIDAGGGTVDITGQEVLPDGQVKEILPSNGGAWGGTQVDNNFKTLLKNILGETFVGAYEKNYPKQWMSFLTVFEKAKKRVKPDDRKTKITMTLGYEMCQAYKEITNRELKQAITEASVEGIKFAQGSLVITHPALARLFQPVTEQIIQHVDTLFESQRLQGCSQILLVGGFGECSFLQKALQDKFADRCKILVPNEAQMVVIKGAVLTGHRPDNVKSRIAKKTYGQAVTKIFVEGKHRSDHLFHHDSVKYCRKIFHPFVEKGESVEAGDTKTFKYAPVLGGQQSGMIKLFSLDRPCLEGQVEYVDSPEFQEIGRIKLEMPEVEMESNREVQCDFTFGGTEVHVCATDCSSEYTVQATVDFLSR